MVQLKHFLSRLLPPTICEGCGFEKHTHHNLQKTMESIGLVFMVQINEFRTQHIDRLSSHDLKNVKIKTTIVGVAYCFGSAIILWVTALQLNKKSSSLKQNSHSNNQCYQYI